MSLEICLLMRLKYFNCMVLTFSLFFCSISFDFLTYLFVFFSVHRIRPFQKFFVCLFVCRLRSTIEKSEKSKPDTSGFYDNDDDLDSKFMASQRKPGSNQYTMITPITRTAREEEVDYNLGESYLFLDLIFGFRGVHLTKRWRFV